MTKEEKKARKEKEKEEDRQNERMRKKAYKDDKMEDKLRFKPSILLCIIAFPVYIPYAIVRLIGDFIKFDVKRGVRGVSNVAVSVAPKATEVGEKAANVGLEVGEKAAKTGAEITKDMGSTFKMMGQGLAKEIKKGD